MKILNNIKPSFNALRPFKINRVFMRTLSLSALASALLWLAVASLAPVVMAEEAVLNLKDAELKTLVEVVSKLTGKTFILDPRVNRSQKITIVSQHKMSEKEIYQVFLSTLKVHNMSAIETGPVVKIIQEQQAKADSTRVTTNSNKLNDTDELITHVLKLNNVAVKEVVNTIRPLIQQQGSVGVYDDTNVLVITDSEANVKRIAKIVEQMDHASTEEIELIPLENAAATEIVRIIEALDKPKAGQTQGPSPARFVADERTNSILLTANPDDRIRFISLIHQLDTPLGTSGNTRVRYLNYAQAADIVIVLKGVGKSIEEEEKQKKGGGVAGGGASRTNNGLSYSIESHEETNSLVITSPPDLMNSFMDIIDRLDIPRVQVHVEAIIVEITESKGKQLGVQWLFGQKGGGNVPTGLINFPSSGIGITDIAGAASLSQDQTNGSTTSLDNNGNPVTTNNSTSGDNGAALATLLRGLAGAGIGFGKTSTSGLSYGAFVQALANDADINILSTPSITTLDNEEASMIVGQEVPITTGQALGSGNANPFQTTERKEIGIKLKVTPQVNSGSAIRFGIEQEVSSLVGGGGQIFNTRKITTSVMVNDGGMIVLGGLISDSVRTSKSKVPFLGDIPYLGKLFRSDSSTTEKTNLMVFIHPTILHNDQDINRFSRVKYNYMRGLQIRERKDGATLTPLNMLPELPEWDEKLELPPSFQDSLKQRERIRNGEED